jgi:8-oxo-dGTP pyrophosphatase MutT (NUDIX family)
MSNGAPFAAARPRFGATSRSIPGRSRFSPLTTRERWALFVDDDLLEVPAGTQDVPGEEPLETAKRELLEELGYEANQWTLLGRFMNSPGWTNQVMTIYEARDLVEGERAPAGPEERTSTIHWLAPEAIREAIRAMPAVDSTTAIALHRVFGTFFDES